MHENKEVVVSLQVSKSNVNRSVWHVNQILLQMNILSRWIGQLETPHNLSYTNV